MDRRQVLGVVGALALAAVMGGGAERSPEVEVCEGNRGMLLRHLLLRPRLLWCLLLRPVCCGDTCCCDTTTGKVSADKTVKAARRPSRHAARRPPPRRPSRRQGRSLIKREGRSPAGTRDRLRSQPEGQTHGSGPHRAARPIPIVRHAARS